MQEHKTMCDLLLPLLLPLLLLLLVPLRDLPSLC
jgi:hypothetical protein